MDGSVCFSSREISCRTGQMPSCAGMRQRLKAVLEKPGSSTLSVLVSHLVVKVFTGLSEMFPPSPWCSQRCPPWSATQGGQQFPTAESYSELFKPSPPLDDTAKGVDESSRLVEMCGRPRFISPSVTQESVNDSVACFVTLQDLTDRRLADTGCRAGVAEPGLTLSQNSQWVVVDSDTFALRALFRAFVPLNYSVQSGLLVRGLCRLRREGILGFRLIRAVWEMTIYQSYRFMPTGIFRSIG